MSAVHTLLAWLPEWPLITQRHARERERNAFVLGVDVGNSGYVSDGGRVVKHLRKLPHGVVGVEISPHSGTT